MITLGRKLRDVDASSVQFTFERSRRVQPNRSRNVEPNRRGNFVTRSMKWDKRLVERGFGYVITRTTSDYFSRAREATLTVGTRLRRLSDPSDAFTCNLSSDTASYRETRREKR